MIKVFIGYDAAEAVAFSALSHSIHSLASEPVSITPIMLSQLQKFHTRDRHQLASTEFSFSRFLTPYLCDYEGSAIFMDCDMLLRADIAQLWALRDDQYAVQVVKHEHKPTNERKFLNNQQTRYDKKNWSSMMIFNCAKCQTLTPEYVNSASGLELHQFKWLNDDEQIGALPQEWNHLVGYNAYDANAKNVHYTEGGPYFDEYVDCEYNQDWFEAREAMMAVVNRKDLIKKVADT